MTSETSQFLPRRAGDTPGSGGVNTSESQTGGHDRFGLSAGLYAILIVLSGTLCAQETEPDEPIRVSEQSVAPDEPADAVPTPLEQESETLPELAARIVAEMHNAESRLIDRQLDDETGELQDRINNDLTKLLKALEEQASPPAPTPSEDSQQQNPGGDSSTGGTGDPGQQPGNASTDAESTEGDRPGVLSDAELEHRRNLATSVWGHLPERDRDEMLGAFSERFLPAYDELVRQYYESLATRGSEDR